MANVPNMVGVPALLTGFSVSAGPVQLTVDSIFPSFGGAGAQWGIFLNGKNVVTADTVAAFDMKKDYVIANYPVEQGGFETYDKVKMPSLPRIRFTSGKNIGNVSALLSAIDAIVGDRNLYSVVTPTAVYTSVNVAHYDYRRTAQNGASMVTVDVWLQEVVVTVNGTASTSETPSVGANPQSPSASDVAYGGSVMSNDAATNTNSGAMPSGVSLGQNVQVPGPQ